MRHLISNSKWTEADGGIFQSQIGLSTKCCAPVVRRSQVPTYKFDSNGTRCDLENLVLMHQTVE